MIKKFLTNKRKFIFVLTGTYILFLFASLFLQSPQKAFAYASPNELPIDQQLLRPYLYGWGDCISLPGGPSGIFFNPTVSPSDMDAHKLMVGASKTQVGHEAVPKDGQIACAGDGGALLIKQSLASLGITSAQDYKSMFINKFYTFDNGAGNYKLNANAGGSGGAIDKWLQSKREQFRFTKNDAYGPLEYKRRILVALAQCIQPANAGAQVGEAVTISGHVFWYRSKKGPGDWVSIGHDIDPTGVKFCRDLVTAAQKGNMISDPTVIDKLFKDPTTLAVGAGGTPVDSGGGSTASKPSCESEGGESSWILCSALRIASSFLSFIDEKLNSFLSVPSSYYESDQVVIAWQRMRNIAYLILVPIMLIMVISTALGFEFISAYTFKKALPRMFVAVLFIALSLEITKFLVIITNEVGQGVLGLVTSAFSGSANVSLATLFNPGGAEGALFTGGVLVGGALAVGIIPVLLLYLASAGLALAVAVFALAFRQMLLITFMILAPVAIIGWIFPGNDKLWKLWWGSFSKLLIIFPLIMLLIGSGRAFATLVQFDGSNDFIATILKLVAYVGPFFFIPAMFKFAGGIFGTITGMANDRGKGAFDRLRGMRKKGYEKAWHRAKEGNYYKGGNETNRRGFLNNAIMGATLLPQSGINPKRFGDNMTDAKGRRELEHSEELMKSTEGRMLQDDDIASALVDANGDEAAFRRILQERAYKRFGGDENADALNAAVSGMKSMSRRHGAGGVRLAALRSKFNSSTGWNNEWEYETDDDGNFLLDDKGDKKIAKDEAGNNKVWKYTASGDMLNDINKVAGANRIMSTQLLSEARSGQTRAGREDTGGGGFSDTAIEMDKLHRGNEMVDVIDEKTGRKVKDAAGNVVKRRYTIADATEKVTESLINGKNVHELFRAGKPAVARAVAPVMLKKTQQSLIESQDRADDAIAIINASAVSSEQKATQIKFVRAQQAQEAVRTIAQEQMMHAVASSSSADVAKEMGDKVFSQPFNLADLPADIRTQVTAVYDYIPVQAGDAGYVAGAADSDQPKKRVQTSSRISMTRGEVYDRLRNDPTWKAYAKEYGATEAAAGIISPEAAAAAASADPGATTPGGGAGGGPGGTP